MQVARSSRLWTRTASQEVGELPLEAAAGGGVTDITAAFSGVGTLDPTARLLRVAAAALSGVGTVAPTARAVRAPSVALSGVGTLDASLLKDGGTVHDRTVAFGGAGSLAAVGIVRLRVVALTLSGAGTVAATLEGGSVPPAPVMAVRVRLDRPAALGFRVGA